MAKVILKVKVIPRAKKEEVIDLGNNQYKVKIKEPPIEGKANKRLVQVLADYFKVSKKCVRIVKGAWGKEKVVEIVI